MARDRCGSYKAASIREAYALDLRQFTTWCRARSLPLFAVRRADIEGFARDLEARGRARATVTRRLSTIAGLHTYAVEEELLDHSPATHVRRPRVDYESHATALDRNELGALLVAAGFGEPHEHAPISLLALNGLRVSEATGADIEQLGLERGHRTLTITRKGGKVVDEQFPAGVRRQSGYRGKDGIHPNGQGAFAACELTEPRRVSQGARLVAALYPLCQRSGCLTVFVNCGTPGARRRRSPGR